MKNRCIIKSNINPTRYSWDFYAKDPYGPKYQLLMKKREDAGIKHYNDSKAFMEYSKTTVVYNNINDYSPNRNRKILIVFDDMITDMNTNKKF